MGEPVLKWICLLEASKVKENYVLSRGSRSSSKMGVVRELDGERSFGGGLFEAARTCALWRGQFVRKRTDEIG